MKKLLNPLVTYILLHKKSTVKVGNQKIDFYMKKTLRDLKPFLKKRFFQKINFHLNCYP